MQRAIVLAGGGAKGSYQIGFWKALRELGIDYQIVTGSSVGALNAALMVQGNYDEALLMWSSVRTEDIVERTPSLLSQSSLSDGIAASLKSIMGDLAEDVVKVKMDPVPLGHLIERYLQESLLRESGVSLGIMTTEYPSMKAAPFLLEDIPRGMVDEYLLASSTVFPSMEPRTIGTKRYVDGGYSDNFPVNLALDLGAEEIIGVGLRASGVEAKYQTDYPVRIIRPNFDLGPSMIFDPEQTARNITLGYNDTMRSFGIYDGKSYTFLHGEAKKLATEMNPYFSEALYRMGVVSVSERQEFYKSLAVKAFAEATKQRFGRMKEELALLSAEAVALIFDVDPLPVYDRNTFAEAVLAKVYPVREESAGRVQAALEGTKTLASRLNQLRELDPKEIVSYLSDAFEKKADKKEMEREYRALVRLAPKEFFAALYLTSLEGQGEG